MTKLKWTPELYEMIWNLSVGEKRSQNEICKIIFDKYDVSYSAPRISQILKKMRVQKNSEGLVNANLSLESRCRK